MPIKLFEDGEILDASDVNTYFMDQALVVFDSAAQRDAAFGGTVGGIPNEPALAEGRICYLKDDDTLYIYTGATWTAQLATIANGAVTSAKLGTDLSLTGTTKIEEIFESATIVAAQPVASDGATLTLTITNGAVYYYTVATSYNIALDIVTTGLVAGQAATLLLMVTSGATTGKISSITVNGAANTAKWFGGNLNPNGSGGSAVDAYTITVFRSSTAYTVFASQSKFA